jgi:hypothetical protein
MTELDLSSNAATYDGNKNGEMSGIIALADTIKDMGAMTSLNLASNSINAEGAKHIAGALKVSKYILAVILVPPSCPSDHCFHCWFAIIRRTWGHYWC